MMSEKFLPARILDRRSIAEDLILLHVDPGGPFSYLAGQYATLGVDVEGKRIERPSAGRARATQPTKMAIDGRTDLGRRVADLRTTSPSSLPDGRGCQTRWRPTFARPPN